MHSSRYRRETSRCMHNMHAIRIYDRLHEIVFWYAVCEMRDVRVGIDVSGYVTRVEA
jgi:hypothetical protein